MRRLNAKLAEPAKNLMVIFSQALKVCTETTQLPYQRTCAPRPTKRPLRIPDGWLYVVGAVAVAIE